MSTTTEEALRAEIERLTGAINRHKSGVTQAVQTQPATQRNASYINPNYNPPKPPSRQNYSFDFSAAGPSGRPTVSQEPREVVIDGVAFQSSGRSLIRKGLAENMTQSQPKHPPKSSRAPRTTFGKPYQGSRIIHRPYKPKPSRGRPQNHNMSLTNGRKPMKVGRRSVKSVKYSDKQCSRFSTTGVCQRGLTCRYQHDPAKIAVCWPFLQGSCPNTSESCPLSHDTTPERTPLCVHFANNGRCKNGSACLFPHVRVGNRTGVCRDFAVLGYCEHGIDCDKQHVRECPDFAENGTCPNVKCKLPHVIRANRRRAAASAKDIKGSGDKSDTNNKSTGDIEMKSPLLAEDGKIGDEFISLTFHESDESDDESDEGEEDQDDLEVDGDDNE